MNNSNEERLKIAVFIDFDNIAIGVKQSLNRVLRHRATEIFCALPVSVGNLGDYLPFFLNRFEYGSHIEIAVQ